MFDAMREELEIEYNARFDYVREAFAGMAEDPATLAAEAADYAAEAAAEWTAFIGPRLPVDDEIWF